VKTNGIRKHTAARRRATEIMTEWILRHALTRTWTTYTCSTSS